MNKKIITFDGMVVILTLLASAYVMYSRVSYYKRSSELRDDYESRKDDILRRAASNLPETRTSRPTSPPRTLRNILFSIKSSAAKKVSVIGDFNDWTPQDMSKDKTGLWTVALAIEPGEYAYNFVVDGRPIKDYNNPKTKNTGRGFISSHIEVKPLE